MYMGDTPATTDTTIPAMVDITPQVGSPAYYAAQGDAAPVIPAAQLTDVQAAILNPAQANPVVLTPVQAAILGQPQVQPWVWIAGAVVLFLLMKR
jgi:hypothetical protein